MPNTDSAQFYTGLIAELYEPLAGDLASPEPVKRFVTKYGTPALELACGAGHPMLDLLAEGLEVHGIDSSQDMLDLCLEKSAERGLDRPTVACQPMQALSLPHRYACCYLAGASFCLLDNIENARKTLAAVHKHLIPQGAFLVSLFRPELVAQPSAKTQQTKSDGTTISVRSVDQREDQAAQIVSTRLRYTRERDGKDLEVVEREWVTRWYRVAEMLALLREAGFTIHRCVDFQGSPALEDATDFSVVAIKDGQQG